jgi:hypothetical protein
MRELFEQSAKMMEKYWKLWQQTVEDSPWMKTPKTTPWGDWTPWIANMRSIHETQMQTWQTMFQPSEESFFQMFKDSPAYDPRREGQMRRFWQGLRKAYEAQGEAVLNQLENMEDLLAQQEKPPEKSTGEDES